MRTQSHEVKTLLDNISVISKSRKMEPYETICAAGHTVTVYANGIHNVVTANRDTLACSFEEEL